MKRCLVNSPEFRRRYDLIIGFRGLAGTVLLMVILLCPPALSFEIIEGKWGGSYQPYQSDPFNAEYLVQYSTEDGKKTLTITMVLIDLEPTVDFTYEFENIKIGETRISFSIKRANIVKQCQLDKQENDSFRGQCQADTDSDAKQLTTIVMIPPGDTKNDCNPPLK